jgi:high-affinity iron transporter
MTFKYQNIAFLQNILNGTFCQKVLLKLFFVVSYLTAIHVSADTHSEDLRQLLQLTEYIGVDYSAAIVGGKVIDQGEFQEMLEFSAIIAEKSNILLSDEPAIVTLSQSLQDAVDKKQSTEIIQSLTAELKTLLLKNSPQLSLPASLLPLEEVAILFQNDCSNCHGLTGQGDGVLAKQLVPEPTNFADHERALNRSILGLYDVISGGLEGTAMISFNQLTVKQRWSLAFYVGSLGFTSNNLQNKSTELSLSPKALSLESLVLFSPNELVRSQPENLHGAIEQLRADPTPLFLQTGDPLTITRNQLDEALAAYKKEDFANAERLAVSAYLDGFELIENNLDAHDKILRKNIESKLLFLRQQLNGSSNANEVKQSVSELFLQLEEAEQLLKKASISNVALFSASLIILLREGLEALLVVIALLTILVRSNKKEAVKYVHFGWSTALVAGFLTWVVAQHLITISGASRETMEGVAAMLAAIVLFYVGFWMHSKTQADQWQRYIKQNIDRSLKAGTLWGISGLAFIAVYREVFETVLFYQSLLTQTIESQISYVVGGFFLGAIILIALAWLLIKYSIKLPIARFFAINTYLLVALSFVLMGKAVSALQEAAIINISPMPVDFSIDWIGVNSTWQGVLSQALILVVFVIIIYRTRIKPSIPKKPT